MKNIMLLSIILMSFSPLFGQFTPQQEQLFSAKSDTLLQQAIDLKDYVGVSAGVSMNDHILWTGGAGYRDLENKIKADGDMLHRTASIAKPMTAVAILQLVENGELDLDAPIQTYLPEFPEKSEGNITTRHLLQHTSGIGAYQSKKEAFPKEHYPTLLDAMQVFKDRVLEFIPGTQYSYTTYGYVVLGAIIEKISGQTYEQYMQEKVWSKADMANTSLEMKGKTYQNKSKLYQKRKGKFTASKQTDLSVKYPGGGIQSTVEDLLLFGQAILNNDLISAATFEMMIEDPKIRKEGNGYGMGWFLYGIHPEYGRIIGHSGSQSGTNTQLIILLDKKIVAATLANTTTNAWGDIFNLNKSFYSLAADTDKLKEPIHTFTTLPKEVLERYEGKYNFDSGRIITLERKEDYFLCKGEGRPDFLLYPVSEERFFFRVMDAVYEFELDENKQIVKVMFKNGEKVSYGEKIE